MMIDYILNYMVVGIIVNLTFEFIPKKEDRIILTPIQRIYLIFTWPLSLIVFIYEFIRVLMYGKDD
eukprot:SAG31_NODE_11466_length_1027_cov_1.053879_3_plen_66_part_00